MKKKIVLIGLNEINFKYIESYIKKGYLPNFKNLFEKYGYSETTSETEYKLLEPWIQWVTLHTGKTYAEHKVYRLGDIIERKDLKQIWEIAEEKGLSVAAISPFNADNRLKESSFFISDPWTNTKPYGTALLKQLSKTVSDTVNENANNKIGIGAAITLIRAILAYVPITKYPKYLKLVSQVFTKKGMKAVFLDVYLGDLFLNLWKKNTPDFSSLFLNAGAHIQHHYMFNSKVYDGKLSNPNWYCPKEQDPLLNVLSYYDSFLGELQKQDLQLLMATGLHQNPHEHVTYYWRLKAHAAFLNKIGVTNFKEAVPRMSRDFLVTFNNNQDAQTANEILATVKSTTDDELIFDIDNRGDSLFIELVYPNDIKQGFNITVQDKKHDLDFFNEVSFVAIKNGEHDGIGYYIDTAKAKGENVKMPLSNVFNEITALF